MNFSQSFSRDAFWCYSNDCSWFSAKISAENTPENRNGVSTENFFLLFHRRSLLEFLLRFLQMLLQIYFLAFLQRFLLEFFLDLSFPEFLQPFLHRLPMEFLQRFFLEFFQRFLQVSVGSEARFPPLGKFVPPGGPFRDSS